MWLSHIRYHGVILWNGVTVYWSSVGTRFGTCSAPGARMWARGLVYPMLVAQTTWFGMLKIWQNFEMEVCLLRGRRGEGEY